MYCDDDPHPLHSLLQSYWHASQMLITVVLVFLHLAGLPQGPVLRMADVHADVIKLQLEELMPAGAHAPATGSSNSSLNAAAFGSGASGRGRSGVSLVRKGPAPPRVPLRFSSLQHYTHVFR